MYEKLLIADIKGRQILDSRGKPTVEAEVYVTNGACGIASVPSGASTGMYEAYEKRDGIKDKFGGMSVEEAVASVNGEIREALLGRSVLDQRECDKIMKELDGTENLSRLGANAVLSVSLAIAKAAAECKNMPLYRYIGGICGNSLPIPMMNIINGGKHADNNLSIQEFMIVPVGDIPYKLRVRKCCEVFYALKSILKASGMSTACGDEGGFAPSFESDEEALSMISVAIEKAGYTLGTDFMLALDVAASEMYNEASEIGEEGKYYFWKTDTLMTRDELISYYASLSERYSLISIEDPLAEEDWEGWEEITARLGTNINLVGDDLFVTNPARIKKGIRLSCGNALLVKVNQIGTLTDALGAVLAARKGGYKIIVSHRSGETEDSSIADIAVALNSEYIKTGAPQRGERTAKYNRLLRIAEEL